MSATSLRFMPMIPGSRIVPNCGYEAKYFAKIDECVLLFITSMVEFLEAFEMTHACSGRVMHTKDELNGLRFCDIVTGALTVTVNDAQADFDVLRDIEAVMGLHFIKFLFVSETHSFFRAACCREHEFEDAKLLGPSSCYQHTGKHVCSSGRHSIRACHRRLLMIRLS